MHAPAMKALQHLTKVTRKVACKVPGNPVSYLYDLPLMMRMNSSDCTKGFKVRSKNGRSFLNYLL
jgi:hypothetical protein